MDNRDRMARDAANQLQGTCLSIANLGPKFEELQNDDVFCRTLDDLVFECEDCSWWCERGEESEEPGVCCDCYAFGPEYQ